MRPDVLRRILALACTVVGATVLLGASLALAAPPKKDLGKDMADEAAVLFQQKEYLRAAELFERAFALNSEKLVRLRNAGRAFEEAGRLEHAKHLFERYLELTPQGSENDDVAVRIRKISKRLAEAAQLAAAPTPTAAPVVVAQEHGPPPNLAGWGLVGGGTVVAAVGAVWLVQLMGAQGEIDDHEAAGHYKYPGGAAKLTADRDTLFTNGLGAYGSLGLGTAAAAAGLWLVLRPDDSSQVRVAPTVGPDRAGATAEIAF
jgi:tetratricopeptide (TPR) repeat protein